MALRLQALNTVSTILKFPRVRFGQSDPKGIADFMDSKSTGFYSLGLAPIQPGDWLREDGEYQSELQQKQTLLAKQPDDIFEAKPSATAAAQELLDTIADELVQVYPHAFQRNGSTMTHLPTGQRWELAKMDPNGVNDHPLVKAGQMVQEDLILMEKDLATGKMLFNAAYVSFPSRWDFHDKMGTDMFGVHQPVPDLNSKSGVPIEAMLDKMHAHKPLWRVNWSVHDLPDLHQLVPTNTVRQPVPITPDNAGDNLWLRVERQTLRRLPVTQAVVFALKTYVYPLKDLGDDVKARLFEKLSKLPPPVLAYKGLTHVITPLMAYLQPKASTQNTTTP